MSFTSASTSSKKEYLDGFGFIIGGLGSFIYYNSSRSFWKCSSGRGIISGGSKKSYGSSLGGGPSSYGSLYMISPYSSSTSREILCIYPRVSFLGCLTSCTTLSVYSSCNSTSAFLFRSCCIASMWSYIVTWRLNSMRSSYVPLHILH